MNPAELMQLAIQVRENAYAPYSGFGVGAALLTENGSVYTGCNVENAAFSPTNCAERTAFFKAISEGERRFRAIAIAGGACGEPPAPNVFPCGVCRQVMAEFCGPDFIIITGTSDKNFQTGRLGDYLPQSFGPSTLK